MAWTSIKALHHRLDISVNYVLDKEKTMLYSAIGYALNRDKTEQTCFESAHRCRLRSAYEDMVETKRVYGKLDGIQGYHMVQSFAEGEVTPELAHQIGKEFVERLLGDEYEAVISTHLNTGNYHNHIVFNSVNLLTGKKYRSNAKSYYTTIRRISDELCQKYNLSIIYPEDGGIGKSYAEWNAERQGAPTYRGNLRKDIDELLLRCFTYQQFIDSLWELGYAVKEHGKHLAVQPPHGERFIRLKSLGLNYTEEAIRERILGRMPTMEDYENAEPPEPRYFRAERRPEKVAKLAGLKALYFHYLYRLGVIRPRRKLTREEYWILRNDIRELDKRIAMYRYINDNGVHTFRDLHAHREQSRAQEHALYLERKRLYRRADAGHETLMDINAQIKAVRKEAALCEDIETHSRKIYERLRTLRDAERERKLVLAMEGLRYSDRHLSR